MSEDTTIRTFEPVSHADNMQKSLQKQSLHKTSPFVHHAFLHDVHLMLRSISRWVLRDDVVRIASDRMRSDRGHRLAGPWGGRHVEATRRDAGRSGRVPGKLPAAPSRIRRVTRQVWSDCASVFRRTEPRSSWNRFHLLTRDATLNAFEPQASYVVRMESSCRSNKTTVLPERLRSMGHVRTYTRTSLRVRILTSDETSLLQRVNFQSLLVSGSVPNRAVLRRRLSRAPTRERLLVFVNQNCRTLQLLRFCFHGCTIAQEERACLL